MDNGFRWLTVTAPQAPDHEIVLFPATGNANGFDEDVKAALKLLLDKGIMGAGVLQTNDCRATYEELKAKGVQFKSEPKEQFYGIECIIDLLNLFKNATTVSLILKNKQYTVDEINMLKNYFQRANCSRNLLPCLKSRFLLFHHCINNLKLYTSYDVIISVMETLRSNSLIKTLNVDVHSHAELPTEQNIVEIVKMLSPFVSNFSLETRLSGVGIGSLVQQFEEILQDNYTLIKFFGILIFNGRN